MSLYIGQKYLHKHPKWLRFGFEASCTMFLFQNGPTSSLLKILGGQNGHHGLKTGKKHMFGVPKDQRWLSEKCVSDPLGPCFGPQMGNRQSSFGVLHACQFTVTPKWQRVMFC